MKTLEMIPRRNRAKSAHKRRLYIEGIRALGLTPAQSNVLVMCRFEGYTAAQVADWFGISRYTVVATLRRAIRNLARRGITMPRPRVGTRREFRAAFPGVA